MVIITNTKYQSKKRITKLNQSNEKINYMLLVIIISQ